MLNAEDSAGQLECNRLLGECTAAINENGLINTITNWENAKRILINRTSINGVTHTFADVEPGMLIDFFNVENDGFMVAKINSVEIFVGPEGNEVSTYSMEIEPVSFKGSPGGETLIKIFQKIQVQEKGDVDALLALDIFQVSYSAEYIMSFGGSLDNGKVNLNIEVQGQQDEAIFFSFLDEDRFGNKHNWIDPDPDPVITDGVTHLRFYQPSTGAVLIGLVESTRSVWVPSSIMGYWTNWRWLVNRGEFVDGEVVVIQAGKYIKPKTMDEKFPSPPMYWQWSTQNTSTNLRAGYFTGPPSLTINDETLNKTSTVYISLPDFLVILLGRVQMNVFLVKVLQ